MLFYLRYVYVYKFHVHIYDIFSQTLTQIHTHYITITSSSLGLPVFDTVADAVAEVKPDASVIYVPPPFCADAIIDAITNEVRIRTCCCYYLVLNNDDMCWRGWG